MGSIFGKSAKSSSQSNSSNQAFGTINNWAQDLLGYAGQGAQGISDFLGGDQTGFNNYKQATGFDALLQDGSRGITGNRAAGGMLRSGGTGKALVNYGNQMQNQYAGDYLGGLGSLAGMGYNAANTLAGAGNVSESTSKSNGAKKGIGGALVSKIAASDRRLKKDIVKLGENKDGLGVYDFYYIYNPFVKQRGTMADEVERLRPDAIGPDLDGYKSVDYSNIDLTIVKDN